VSIIAATGLKNSSARWDDVWRWKLRKYIAALLNVKQQQKKVKNRTLHRERERESERERQTDRQKEKQTVEQGTGATGPYLPSSNLAVRGVGRTGLNTDSRRARSLTK